MRRTFITGLVLAGAMATVAGIAGWAWRRHREAAHPSSGAMGRPDGPIFASLQPSRLLSQLFPPTPGLERRLVKALPFHLGSTERVLWIVAEYTLDAAGHREEGHVSAPLLSAALFSRSKDGWHLQGLRSGFATHGSYGEAGDVALTFLGPDEPVVVLPGGYTAQGVTVCATRYHRLLDAKGGLDLKEILKLMDSYDDAGVYDEPDQATSVASRTETLPAPVNGWYPVRITHKGSTPRVEADRVVGQTAIDTTTVFSFDPASGTYRPVPGTPADGWWKNPEDRVRRP